MIGLAESPARAADYSRIQADDKSTGVGVVLGEPTGFTAKFWLQPDRAVDAGLAFSFSDFVLVYSDYLFHFRGAFGNSNPFLHQLVPYVGLGGELFVSESSDRTGGPYYTPNDSSVGFGIRIPLGLEWLVPRAPLGIFLELVPGVGIVPSTFGFFQGGIGARFYF